MFKLAGNVQRVEVMQSKDGKSRGMATVSFDTQLEALQAICILNAQKNLNHVVIILKVMKLFSSVKILGWNDFRKV